MPTTGPTAALVRKIADALLACPIGQRISYSRISAETGIDIQERSYLIQRALDLANKETGALFVNVRTVGYERLQNAALCAIGQRARAKGRRIHRRAAKWITNTLVRSNDVPEQERLRAYSEQATLGLLSYLSYDRNMPKVAEDAKPPPNHEVVRQTVETLRSAFIKKA